jgi:hypothetical protein
VKSLYTIRLIGVLIFVVVLLVAVDRKNILRRSMMSYPNICVSQVSQDLKNIWRDTRRCVQKVSISTVLMVSSDTGQQV